MICRVLISSSFFFSEIHLHSLLYLLLGASKVFHQAILQVASELTLFVAIILYLYTPSSIVLLVRFHVCAINSLFLAFPLNLKVRKLFKTSLTLSKSEITYTLFSI